MSYFNLEHWNVHFFTKASQGFYLVMGLVVGVLHCPSCINVPINKASSEVSRIGVLQ